MFLCYSAEKEISLTPTIERPGSCVALSCIMKAGRNCSTIKKITLYWSQFCFGDPITSANGF
jgi:hypothetical protein